MFGLNETTHTLTPPLDGALIDTLAPYATLSADARQTALQHAAFVTVGAGLLNDRMPSYRRYYLIRGNLQIQTRSGTMLMLRGDSPQARFAMPGSGEVVSLLATEPCVFLTLPADIDASLTAPRHVAPAGPRLTAEEDDALQLLRAFLGTCECELPSLPDLAIKIGRAIDDPDIGNTDIARLVQIDPALTARLLSVVNSAAFGGIGKIGSVQQAIARLGRNKVRSLMYSCLLKSIFKIEFPALKQRMETLWEHSAQIAALSFVLGRATPGIDPEQALLAGLVHDIGAIAVIHGAGSFPVLTERAEVLDHAVAGLRADLGLRVLAQWGLDGQLQAVIADAEHWTRMGTAVPELADVVVLAQLHALIGSPQSSDRPQIGETPAFLKLAQGGLTPQRSLQVLEEAAAEVREVHALIGDH